MEFLNPLRGRLTASMNEHLSSVFSIEKVKEALFQMHPTKAPGQDGLPPLFYQKYFHLVGDSVTAAALRVLNTSNFLSKFNHTYITLVPKKEGAERIEDFHPISLCNMLYKIVTKVIANRLKPILPSIISKTQSAFISGW